VPTSSPARSRPPGGRGPLGRPTDPNASVRRRGSTQQPAFSESAGLASRVDQRSAFERVRMRRDRRAAGASAGGKSDRDGCLHPERSGFSPDAGDPGSPALPPAPLANSFEWAPPLCAFASLSLCVVFRLRTCLICLIYGQATSPTQVPLLCVLRVFVVATILRSVASVPLWFAGNRGGLESRAMLESTISAITAGRSRAAPPFSPT
jgi:hypothetical protein